MLGLIFNDDGSIFAAALPKYVTQGSSGDLDSLKICIAFKDSNITDEGNTVICRFRLPDGTKNDITLFNNGTFEFQSTEYNCKYGYLTADQTLYEGILLVSIEVLTDFGSNILYTYNARITVNPTTYDPTSDYVLINNAQYENLATQIENLQYRGASKQYVNEIVTHAVFEDVSVVFDNVPTQNSNNAVKSGGVYTWFSDLVTRIEGGGVIPWESRKARNVTEAINGANLNDIFENDRTTVKNATNAAKTSFTNIEWSIAEWENEHPYAHCRTGVPNSLSDKVTMQFRLYADGYYYDLGIHQFDADESGVYHCSSAQLSNETIGGFSGIHSFNLRSRRINPATERAIVCEIVYVYNVISGADQCSAVTKFVWHGGGEGAYDEPNLKLYYRIIE